MLAIHLLWKPVRGKQFLETDDLGTLFCRDLSKSHGFVNIPVLLLRAEHLNPSDLDQEQLLFGEMLKNILNANRDGVRCQPFSRRIHPSVEGTKKRPRSVSSRKLLIFLLHFSSLNL
jgi:hypothetical protein